MSSYSADGQAPRVLELEGLVPRLFHNEIHGVHVRTTAAAGCAARQFKNNGNVCEVAQAHHVPSIGYNEAGQVNVRPGSRHVQYASFLQNTSGLGPPAPAAFTRGHLPLSVPRTSDSNSAASSSNPVLYRNTMAPPGDEHTDALLQSIMSAPPKKPPQHMQHQSQQPYLQQTAYCPATSPNDAASAGPSSGHLTRLGSAPTSVMDAILAQMRGPLSMGSSSDGAHGVLSAVGPMANNALLRSQHVVGASSMPSGNALLPRRAQVVTATENINHAQMPSDFDAYDRTVMRRQTSDLPPHFSLQSGASRRSAPSMPSPSPPPSIFKLEAYPAQVRPASETGMSGLLQRTTLSAPPLLNPVAAMDTQRAASALTTQTLPQAPPQRQLQPHMAWQHRTAIAFPGVGTATAGHVLNADVRHQPRQQQSGLDSDVDMLDAAPVADAMVAPIAAVIELPDCMMQAGQSDIRSHSLPVLVTAVAAGGDDGPSRQRRRAYPVQGQHLSAAIGSIPGKELLSKDKAANAVTCQMDACHSSIGGGDGCNASSGDGDGVPAATAPTGTRGRHSSDLTADYREEQGRTGFAQAGGGSWAPAYGTGEDRCETRYDSDYYEDEETTDGGEDGAVLRSCKKRAASQHPRGSMIDKKAMCRERNRVAQRRFRERQKDLIGLLQAQVKEQKTLIMELKIRLAMHEGTQQAGTAKGKAEGPPPLEGSEW